MPEISSPVNSPDVQCSAHLKLFLVCGMTGAGKSTFINAATGAELSVSGSVDSETPEVVEEGIPLIKSGDGFIQLVDTPGFGDSRLESESDVLRPIASWLAARHMSKYPVTGVIFVRPMETVRVNQEEKSLMLMFKDMVGEDLLDHIVLLTTRWPSDRNDEYEAREKEIISRDDLLGSLETRKIQVRRLKENYSPGDAQDVIKSCTDLASVTFRIQREVVNEEKSLGETQAGIRIGADLGEKIVGLEERAKSASEHAKNEMERLERAEKEKRKLEEEAGKEVEEAKRAAEAEKEAQKQAEAAKAEMDKAREMEEERARKAEEEKQAALRQEEETKAQQERQRAEEEERMKKAEEEAKAAQQRADEAAAEAARLQEVEAHEAEERAREQDPGECIRRGFEEGMQQVAGFFEGLGK